MEKYITDSLGARIIRPSSCPMIARFFFVEKKDKSLGPCIDYCGLNNIKVKKQVPIAAVDRHLWITPGGHDFHQIRPAQQVSSVEDKGGRRETAFNTHHGHLEYLVMLFGPVWAVLFQQKNSKFHPCTYYSHRLSSAGRPWSLPVVLSWPSLKMIGGDYVLLFSLSLSLFLPEKIFMSEWRVASRVQCVADDEREWFTIFTFPLDFQFLQLEIVK